MPVCQDCGSEKERLGQHLAMSNCQYHEPLHVDEIGAFVKDPKTGETVLLRDNFCDICDYVRAEDEVGELTSFLR